jgi:hypothetical protein
LAATVNSRGRRWIDSIGYNDKALPLVIDYRENQWSYSYEVIGAFDLFRSGTKDKDQIGNLGKTSLEKLFRKAKNKMGRKA